MKRGISHAVRFGKILVWVKEQDMSVTSKPVLVSENNAPVTTNAVQEMEHLKREKELLEQKIAEIHSQSRGEALELVQKICAQYEFTPLVIGLSVDAAPKKPTGLRGLFGPKDKSFKVARKRAAVEK